MNQPIQPQGNITQLGDPQTQQAQALVAVESSKAVQEVQASLIIAKRFPRDEIAAQRKIINACQRQGLAEVATYSYGKGGAAVTGPSIRLAEAMAQYWGNIDFGWREIDRRTGVSTVQAYCWDKETNTRREMTFDVKHVIDTKSGGKILTDERSIYENNANMAARRMRACILAMIPGDIIEDAVAECEKTLSIKTDVTDTGRVKLLEGFKGYGVTKEMIEARIQRNMDAITPAQFIGLCKIATSIKDGMSQPEDWFDFSLAEKKTDEKKPQPTQQQKQAEGDKGSLENFKAKHADPAAAEVKPSMEEKLQKAEAAVKTGKGPVAKQETLLPKADEDCQTCGGTGVFEDGNGKGPCADCQGG